MEALRAVRANNARHTPPRAGNAGLIATIAIAAAGVVVGAVSAYLGERGAAAVAANRPIYEKELSPAAQERAARDKLVARIVSGEAPPERLPPPTLSFFHKAPKPKIILIVDDMGIDKKMSQRALTLPGPVTYSFLPYGRETENLADEARTLGDTLMLHLPMEPEGDADPGPHALKSGMTGAAFMSALEWNLSRFDGYVGVNNHMGSKLTTDVAVMKTVIAYLDQKGLFFLDSVTTSDSEAQAAARELGVDVFARDVFLDNDVDDVDAIRAQLALAERIAVETGYVVAICHPRKKTLEIIGPWLTSAPARGFELAPASALLEMGKQPTAHVENDAGDAPALRL